MIENARLRVVYKSLGVSLLGYALVAGFAIGVPDIGGNLGQTSRNLFYHVPMWFTMYAMMAVSLWHSVRVLRRPRLDMQSIDADRIACEAARLGVFFGCLGLVTGMTWARVTWGELLHDTDPTAYWSWDPKQTGALIAVLAYLAYFVLRSSFDEVAQRARVAAVYNVFAAAALVPLTLIIPRQLQSLHPGAEGSPVFNSSDIAPTYRLVFYPAVLGFILLAVWLLELRVRLRRIEENESKLPT
jgi:heme exporter protein C